MEEVSLGENVTILFAIYFDLFLVWTTWAVAKGSTKKGADTDTRLKNNKHSATYLSVAT